MSRAEGASSIKPALEVREQVKPNGQSRISGDLSLILAALQTMRDGDFSTTDEDMRLRTLARSVVELGGDLYLSTRRRGPWFAFRSPRAQSLRNNLLFRLNSAPDLARVSDRLFPY